MRRIGWGAGRLPGERWAFRGGLTCGYEEMEDGEGRVGCRLKDVDDECGSSDVGSVEFCSYLLIFILMFC